MATVIQFDRTELLAEVDALKIDNAIKAQVTKLLNDLGVTYDSTVNSIIGLNADLRDKIGTPSFTISKVADKKHSLTINSTPPLIIEFNGKVPPRDGDDE